MSTIVDVVVADKNLATMSKGIKAAGLENALGQTGPFTVFAPTEIAFGKLASGVLVDLLKAENKIKLTGMMNYHVVDGKKKFSDLKDGEKLKTIDGKELDVVVNSTGVLINGSKIQGRDHEASNGIVHSVDAVMTVK